MKKLLLLSGVSILILLGAGCKNITTEQNSSVPPVVNKSETSTPAIGSPTLTGGAALIYVGTWFDIAYPKDFTVSPTSPVEDMDGREYIDTNEATFTSPDGSVEFFVFSPQWDGEPKNYLKIKNTEVLVSEATDESGYGYEKQITRRVTLKAKDGSYFRSFVSIQEQLETDMPLHHVFGITYKNEQAYATYKTDYLKFEESLQQYGD